MQAREEVLNDLFGGKQQYVIPAWQRRFRWTTQQVAGFWNDLVTLYRARMAGELGASHFVGSFVLVERKDLRKHVNDPTPVHVVDGQQRLTTASLLLAAFRDVAKLKGGFGLSFEEYLLNEKSKGDLRVRLRPQEEDFAQFRAIAEGIDLETHDGTTATGRAYTTLFNLLTAVVEEVDFDAETFLNTLLEGFEVVTVTLEQEDNFHRIFETLNATGLSLTDTDLIRNYVFIILNMKDEDEYKKAWQPVESKLQKNLTNFLVCDLIRQGKPATAKPGVVYTYFKQQLKHVEQDVSLAREEIAGLSKRAGVYSRILPDQEPHRGTLSNSVGGRLGFLWEWGGGKLGSTPVHAVLYQLLLADADLDLGLRIIQSYLVRRFLCGVPANLHRATFDRIASSKKFRLNPISVLRDELLTASEKTRWPSDTELLDGVKKVQLYNPKDAKKIFLILKELAYRKQSKEFPVGITFGTKIGAYQIEHVLPQHPQLWNQDLKTWAVKDVVGFVRTRTDVLGNLTLTAFNPDMNNRPFGEKRPYYLKGALSLTREVGEQYEKWTASQVDQRGTDLHELLVKVWPQA